MIRTIDQLFQSASQKEILDAISVALKNSTEAPFWSEKVIPFSEATLSVLIELREQNLLFTPEGKPADTLSAELFLQWCELYSLRSLAFTLQKSNTTSILQNTKYDMLTCKSYKYISLEHLGSYLSKHMVNLDNIMVDFPVTHYNLHVGIHDVIKKLIIKK
ncbi:MAG: hypothetical protein U9R50_11975 [Campylobacterota bacterium]|nr:hypothetical protein [Campylobacterota bacterium]